MHHLYTWNNFRIFKLHSCIPLPVQILITDSLRFILHVPVGEVKRARGEKPMEYALTSRSHNSWLRTFNP